MIAVFLLSIVTVMADHHTGDKCPETKNVGGKCYQRKEFTNTSAWGCEYDCTYTTEYDGGVYCFKAGPLPVTNCTEGPIGPILPPWPGCMECLEEYCTDCTIPCTNPWDPSCWTCVADTCLSECAEDCLTAGVGNGTCVAVPVVSPPGCLITDNCFPWEHPSADHPLCGCTCVPWDEETLSVSEDFGGTIHLFSGSSEDGYTNICNITYTQSGTYNLNDPIVGCENANDLATKISISKAAPNTKITLSSDATNPATSAQLKLEVRGANIALPLNGPVDIVDLNIGETYPIPDTDGDVVATFIPDQNGDPLSGQVSLIHIVLPFILQ